MPKKRGGKKEVRSELATLNITQHKSGKKVVVAIRAGKNIQGRRPGTFIKRRSVSPKEAAQARRGLEFEAKQFIKELSSIRPDLVSRLGDQGIDAKNVKTTKNFLRISDTKSRLNRAGRVGAQFEVIYEDHKGNQRSSSIRAYSARTRKSMSRLSKKDVERLIEQAARAAAKRVMLDSALPSESIIDVQVIDGPFFAYDIDKKSGYARKGDIDAIEGFKPSQRKRFLERKIERASGFPRRRFDPEELKQEKEERVRRAQEFSEFPERRE